MYFSLHCNMKLLSLSSLFNALRYPLSMKCYLPFCETLNPSCIYSARNCRIDLSALGFRNVYTEAAFSLSRARRATLSRQPSLYTAIVYSCHPPAQLHPGVEIRIDQISPPSWNACAGVCVDPNQLRCSREFDFSSCGCTEQQQQQQQR